MVHFSSGWQDWRGGGGTRRCQTRQRSRSSGARLRGRSGTAPGHLHQVDEQDLLQRSTRPEEESGGRQETLAQLLRGTDHRLPGTQRSWQDYHHVRFRLRLTCTMCIITVRSTFTMYVYVHVHVSIIVGLNCTTDL